MSRSHSCVSVDCLKSLALLQTCQPSAQRSSTEQPSPFGRGESFPAPRWQLGASDAAVATPATAKPPAQPATLGCFTRLVNASRLPSEHPGSTLPCASAASRGAVLLASLGSEASTSKTVAGAEVVPHPATSAATTRARHSGSMIEPSLSQTR